MNQGKLAKLNDNFRKTFTGGKVILTQRVCFMSEDRKFDLLELVKNYSSFTYDNDPYGEHDFGMVTLRGENFFWKIDYYDNNFTYHSPEPDNLELCKRVMTIMHSSEY